MYPSAEAITQAPPLGKAGRRGDWLRIALVPLFVAACYLIDWHAWRAFNCSVYVAISRWLGMPAVRVSYDTFFALGRAYRFAVACTAIDAYSGSIPLLWERHKSIAANCLFLAAYFALLFGANMLRLAAGMLLLARGVPWWLCHEVFAGVCYFLLFLWIGKRRGWSFTAVGFGSGAAKLTAAN